jgi:hypothetical protein
MAEPTIFEQVLTALGNAATIGGGVYSLFGDGPKQVQTAGPPPAQSAIEQQLLGGAAAGQQIGLNEAMLGQFRRPQEDQMQANLRAQLTNQISRRVGGNSNPYGTSAPAGAGGGRAALIAAMRARQGGQGGAMAAPGGTQGQAGAGGMPGGLNLAALLQLLGGGGTRPTNAQPGGATNAPGTTAAVPSGPTGATPTQTASQSGSPSSSGGNMGLNLASLAASLALKTGLPQSTIGNALTSLFSSNTAGPGTSFNFDESIFTGIGGSDPASGAASGGFDLTGILGGLLGPLSKMLGAPAGYSAGLGSLGAAAGGAGPLGIAASFAGPLLIGALTGQLDATNNDAKEEYQQTIALRKQIAEQVQAGQPVRADDLRYIGFEIADPATGRHNIVTEELAKRYQQMLAAGTPPEKSGDGYIFRNVVLQPIALTYGPRGEINPTGGHPGRPVGDSLTFPSVFITQSELDQAWADVNYREPTERERQRD